MRKVFFLLVVAVVLAGVNVPAHALSLVINEIMQNPRLVSDSSGEWFELYNPTDQAININGWTVRDNNKNSHIISNGGALWVSAGGFLVFGKNGDTATNGGVFLNYQYSSNFYLGNSADELILIDSNGMEIDRVAWDNGSTFPDPNGASMELIDPLLDNFVGANWLESTSVFGIGDLGTPGAPNSCYIAPCPAPVPEPGTLILFSGGLAVLGAIGPWRKRTKTVCSKS